LGKRWEKAGNENITGVQIQCNCTVVTKHSSKGGHKFEGAFFSVKRERLLPDVACLQ